MHRQKDTHTHKASSRKFLSSLKMKLMCILDLQRIMGGLVFFFLLVFTQTRKLKLIKLD